MLKALGATSSGLYCNIALYYFLYKEVLLAAAVCFVPSNEFEFCFSSVESWLPRALNIVASDVQ